MNLKKLFLMLTFFVLLGTTAFAQSTIYVYNGAGGVDTKTGISSDPADPINGPVATITRAVELSVDGSTISIAYTGVPYSEPGAPAGTATINKSVTFVVTGAGTNLLDISAIVNMNGASKVATFNSPFKFSTALWLQNGSVAGASNITIGTGALIRRFVSTSILTSAPIFAGTVNLQYNATMTIGNEFPTATTVASNLAVTAGTLTINRAVTLNGTLTATGAISLGSSDLTLKGSSAKAHVVDAGITSTTGKLVLDYSTTSSSPYVVSVDRSNAGSLALPSVTMQGGDNTVDIGKTNASTTVTIDGNLVNSSGNYVTVGKAAQTGLFYITGNVTNSTYGTMTLVGSTAAGLTIDGNLTNEGTYTVSSSSSLGNWSNSGFISLTNAGTILVKGSVLNSPVIQGTITSVTVSNIGNISFAGNGLTINGDVTNSADVQISTSASSTSIVSNLGNISFPNKALTIKGLTKNDTKRTAGTKGSGSTVSNLGGNITFANITTNVAFEGGLTNNASSGFGSGISGSGSILFAARTTGSITVGLSGASANLVNSAASTSGNGIIDFRNDSTPLTYVATGLIRVYGTISLQGTAGTGGINLGSGQVTATAVSITRAVSGATIAHNGSGVATALDFGTFSMNATGATFSVPAASSGGTITFASFSLSAGTVSILGTDPITVTGNYTANGGSISYGTLTRNVTLGGTTVNVNGANFSSGTATIAIASHSATGYLYPNSITAHSARGYVLPTNIFNHSKQGNLIPVNVVSNTATAAGGVPALTPVLANGDVRVTVASTTGFVVGQTINFSGTQVATGLDGAARVITVVVSATEVDVTAAGVTASVGAQTGTAECTIAAATMTTITATNHGLTPGQTVNIEGAGGVLTNGAYTVASVPSANTFQIAAAAATYQLYAGDNKSFAGPNPLGANFVRVAAANTFTAAQVIIIEGLAASLPTDITGTMVVGTAPTTSYFDYNPGVAVAASATGITTKTVSGANAAGVVRITATGSNLSAGQSVTITGAGGTLTNGVYTVLAGATANTFDVTMAAAYTAAANHQVVSAGNNAQTTLIFNGNGGLQGQTFTSGVNTTWPGNFTVNNAFPVAPIFTFVTGNLTIGKVLTFSKPGALSDGINLADGRLILTYSDGTGAAEFVNAMGYTGTTGMVSMQGTALQQMTGTGSFYNIEINNAAGANFDANDGGTVTTHKITGTLHLTNGPVNVGTADLIQFNNTLGIANIVRNAGTLAVAPTFSLATDMLNVTYTKTAYTITGLELPTAATRLNNLSVYTGGGSQTVRLSQAAVAILSSSATAGGLVTVTTAAAHGLVTGDQVTIAGATDGVINNPYTVTYATNTTFTVAQAGAPGSGVAAGTVALTGGLNAASNITVNGTLTTNANQTLSIGNNDVTILGASVVNNGHIISAADGSLILGLDSGTAITGTGKLPSIEVAAGSYGNTLSGQAGLRTNNLTVGTGDLTLTGDGALTVSFTGSGPHVAALTTGANSSLTLGSNLVADGNMAIGAGTLALGTYNLTFQAGTNTISNDAVITGTGSLIAKAAGQTLDGVAGSATVFTVPNLNITQTANANSLVVGTGGIDMVISGSLTLTRGNLDIRTGQKVTVTGTTVNLSKDATASLNNDILMTSGGTTGIFSLAAPAGSTTIVTMNGDPRTIVNLDIAGNATFALLAEVPVKAVNVLSVTALTHSDGLLDNGGWEIRTPSFTRTGTNSTYAGNGYLTITGAVFAQGSGAVIPNLKINAALTTAANAFTVSKNLFLNDVILTHDGNLSVGESGGSVPNITIVGAGNLDGAPTFAQGTANYIYTVDAVDVVSVTTAAAGAASTITIRTPRTFANLDIVTFANFSNTTANPTLSNLNGSFTVQAGGITATTFQILAPAGGLTAATVSGQVALSTAAINTVVVNDLGNSEYWPATPTTLCNSLTVNFDANTDKLLFNASRSVNGASSLNLTRGILSLNNSVVLTLVDGITINRNGNSSLVLDDDALAANGTGSFVGTNVNLVYSGTTTAGNEFYGAQSVNNITNSSGTLTFALTASKTLLGNLTATSDIVIGSSNTTARNFTVTGSISVASGKTLTVNTPATLVTPGNLTITGTLAGTGSLLAGGNTVFNGNMALATTFNGASGQTLTLPATGATVTNLTLNLSGINAVLNVVGGNLTLADAGTLTFVNGIVDMGTQTLILPRPSAAGVTNSGLSFDRSQITGTNVGHIVGKVQRRALTNDGNGNNGRFEFPVGTLTGQYRPAMITFTPDYPVGNPVDIIVSHLDATPSGTVNLPLDGGNGVKIGNYPSFYWYVQTSPSSLTSTQKFDMDLQANNIGVPYTSDQLLRMIRRQDGSATSNGWSMQGIAANYSNYQVVNGADTTVVVRTVSGQGGLISQGSRFTIGVPSRAPIFSAPILSTFSVAEGATTANTIQFTAVAMNSGETITYSKVSGPTWASLSTAGLLTLTPGYSDASATAYPVVVKATTNSELSTEYTVNITVTNADRAPVFAAATETVNPATATTATGVAKTVTYTATDADADVIAYSYTVTPAVSAGSVVFSATLGTLTFTPVFADVANSPFTFVVTASSGTPVMTAVVNTVFTVTNSGLKGDVNLSGTVTSADALLVLNYVVNPTTYPLTAQQLWAADCDASGVGNGTVGAYDAASILIKAGGGNFLAKQVAAAGTVEFGSFTAEKGVFTLPINIGNTVGVKSFYSEIQLGSSVEFSGVSSRLPEGWVMVSNLENGTLKIAMAGLTPLTDGAVAFVNLSLKDKDASVSIQGSALLNDQIGGALNAVKIREIPSEFSLSQNYPNPFNPTTSIKYGISENSRVNLVVYNILGQAVRTLVNAEQESGYYTVRWDGTNDFGGKVSSGVYIYRISAGNFTSTVKMNLLK